MRLFCDTNIVSRAVSGLRAAGHDVVYGGERANDPGDAALLAEAHSQGRIFITKDHDIGALVYAGRAPHAGILLIDDLAHPFAEFTLIADVLAGLERELTSGAFVPAGVWGVRVSA